MPSPDLTPYVNLTLYDRDSQDVFDLATADLQAKLPEWVMRESNIEVMLLEAMALEVAEGVYAINRLPGAITEILLRLYGITRNYGTQPSTTLTFTVADSIGHDIPAGTRARLNMSGGMEPVVFSTDAVLTIPPGSTTGTVTATGDRYTADANGTVAGTVLELLDAVTFVDIVTLGTPVGAGVEPEEDTDWFTRGVTRFSRLNETLVLPDHFTAAALEDPSIYRATAIDNYDPGSGNGPGADAGHVTVAAYGNNAPLAADQKTALAASLDSRSQANLAVHVMDPTLNTVDVTATVHSEAGYSTTDVHDGIVAALQSYLSTANWDWGGTVRRNELIALINNVTGVAYVDSVTLPADDINLTGVAPLAVAGTLDITVTGV